MNERKRKIFAALLSFALLGAAVGAVSAAPGSIDSSPPTDTSTQVYLQDGKTVQTNFTANGSISYGLPILNSSTSDLAMNVSHNGVTYYEFSGTWDGYNSGQATTSDDYIHNFTGDELSKVPMDIGENVTLNVTYWNASADSPTPTTIQVYVENGDVRSVQRVTSDAAFASVETKSPPPYKAYKDEYQAVSVDQRVDVNGSETDVIYTLGTQNTSEAFANATSELSTTGAFTFVMADVDTSQAENPVPVFYQSKPSWYNASDFGTYGVYNPDSDIVTFETASEFKNVSEGQFKLTSDVYRVTDAYTVFKLAGGWQNPKQAASAMSKMVM